MHADLEGFEMPEAELVDALVDRCRMVGDPTRLRILVALAQGESNVGCLAELAGANAAAVSQHLAKLRLAGIVRAQRSGQQVFYELVDGDVADLIAPLVARTRARRSDRSGAGVRR